MLTGDTTNSLRLSLTNHAGTHMDFPRHFLRYGKTLNEYDAGSFVFSRPAIAHIPLRTGRYITGKDLRDAAVDPAADMLLIRTGYDELYEDPRYWNDNPGLDPSAADYLKSFFQGLRCVGMDFLSVNAYKDKQPGRKAHKMLLSRPEILILEDMDLSALQDAENGLRSVIAAPLLIDTADGAPCTVIGELL
jgi:kynurenine formamidase